MNREEPKKAFELERESRAKLATMGVKIVDKVDKSGFEKIATPMQDKIAKDLGPNAEKVLALVRATK